MLALQGHTALRSLRIQQAWLRPSDSLSWPQQLLSTLPQLQDLCLDALVTSRLSAVLADAASCRHLRRLVLRRVTGGVNAADVRLGLRALAAGACREGLQELWLGCSSSMCGLDLGRDVGQLLLGALPALRRLGVPLEGCPGRGREQCARWLRKRAQRLAGARVLEEGGSGVGCEDEPGAACCVKLCLGGRGRGGCERELALSSVA